MSISTSPYPTPAEQAAVAAAFLAEELALARRQYIGMDDLTALAFLVRWERGLQGCMKIGHDRRVQAIHASYRQDAERRAYAEAWVERWLEDTA